MKVTCVYAWSLGLVARGVLVTNIPDEWIHSNGRDLSPTVMDRTRLIGRLAPIKYYHTCTM